MVRSNRLIAIFFFVEKEDILKMVLSHVKDYVLKVTIKRNNEAYIFEGFAW